MTTRAGHRSGAQRPPHVLVAARSHRVAAWPRARRAYRFGSDVRGWTGLEY